MANNQPSTSTFPATTFDINRSMSDSQFRQTWTQISTAANAAYASPTPQTAQSKAYMKNLHTWSTTTTPQPRTAGAATRSSRARSTRTSTLANPPTAYAQPVYQPPPMPMPPLIPHVAPNPPRPPLPTARQALESTYASRLRTGATLLMQPILANPTAAGTRAATRRGGVINYADPGSGDDLPDAGALDSDDSDFAGGTRSAIRQSRSRGGISVYNPTTSTSTPRTAGQQVPEKAELDQSYLGMVPPAKFIKPRQRFAPTPHLYPLPDMMERQAQQRNAVVPIRVEFETGTYRVRDCFVWNVNETVIKPEQFAKIFCYDLDLPMECIDIVANQIKAQLEDNEPVASMDLGLDGAMDVDAVPENIEEIPECRVILSIDVQIANHHLMDHIEWDLLSPLTPEAFSEKLCQELGLTGEAVPLIAHAIHEELIKHKKDAIEWGVIGGDRDVPEDHTQPSGDKAQRDRSALVKDKTGLGLGWGRAPKDGRGPKTLKSVWRDWAEAEEFRTKFEILSAEEVERREIEKERASRRLRRETSKFQSSRTARYRQR